MTNILLNITLAIMQHDNQMTVNKVCRTTSSVGKSVASDNTTVVCMAFCWTHRSVCMAVDSIHMAERQSNLQSVKLIL